MLVLSRKSQQSVIVGSPVNDQQWCKVTVLEINGSKVRLGFEVQRSVPVHRLELWERLQVPAEDVSMLPAV